MQLPCSAADHVIVRSSRRSSTQELSVSVVVTGSIATDHLMTFPGRFAEQFVEGQMENVSLSFLVDDLVQHRGGAGANMAYGLGLLGLGPVLVGAVGNDFTEYDAWLTRHGVDTRSVHWSELKHTARFVCTTDQANNQIASFYSGAMAEASGIELAPVEARVGFMDLVSGADTLFTNEYEAALLMQKTGWTSEEVLARVGTWVTTRAADGVLV